MSKAPICAALLLAAFADAYAVTLVPREIYVPSASPQASARSDVASGNYRIHFDGGERACAPIGVSDSSDRAFIDRLPYSARDQQECYGPKFGEILSADWAAIYNREVLRLLLHKGD